jgi:hypothetical protein
MRQKTGSPFATFFLAVVTSGYYYAGPGANAVLCPINTYNPGLNRLTTCYACPSGLITTGPGSNLKLDCCKYHHAIGLSHGQSRTAHWCCICCLSAINDAFEVHYILNLFALMAASLCMAQHIPEDSFAHLQSFMCEGSLASFCSMC